MNIELDGKLKIGVDIRCLQDSQPSGVGEYTKRLIESLIAMPNEHEWVLFANSHRSVKLPDWSSNKVTLKTFRWPNKILNIGLKNGLVKLDRLVGGVDLWWQPNWQFTSVSRSCPLVLTVHDLSFEHLPELYSVKRWLWHEAIDTRGLCKKAAKIIAVSETTKSDVVNLYNIPGNKVVSVLSGVSPDYRPIDLDTDTIKEVIVKHRLDQPFILCAASLEPRKNLMAVLQAFEQLPLPEMELVLIGPHNNPYRDWSIKNKNKNFVKRCANSPKRTKIKLLNYLTEKDKIALYNLASVFVYPSMYEGFGFPPLEAMACETPVVASYTGALTEILGEAALLVDPTMVHHLTAALQKVLTNRELSTQLVVAGKKRVSEFSWQKTATQTLRVFESLATDLNNPQPFRQ